MPIVAYPDYLSCADRSTSSVRQLLLYTATSRLRTRIYHIMLCGRRLRETIVVMVVMDDCRSWLIRDSGRLLAAEPVGFGT